MSKELEALERIKSSSVCGISLIGIFNKEISTIETALKENERLRTSYLENLLNEESKEYIYKKLKALEIIKKYPKVPIQRLIAYEKNKAKGYDVGTLEDNDIPYTQEEYDLLKEVLL